MSAKEMFEKLGYELDEETRFGAVISYTKYCEDGCCRLYDLLFYLSSKVIKYEEECISMEMLQAINKQVEELEWLRGEDNE